MESLNILKGYDKVNNNHLEDQSQSQSQSHRRRYNTATIAISAVLLLTLLIGFAVAALIHECITEQSEEEEDDKGAKSTTFSNSTEEAIKFICGVTQYPESCITSTSSLTKPSLKPDPQLIFNLSLQVSINQLNKLSSTFKSLKGLHRQNAALADCSSQLEEAVSQMNESVKKIGGSKELTKEKMNDIQTWISAAMTDQETCFDGLEEMGTTIDDQVKDMMQKSKEYMSNNLAIVANMQTILKKFGLSLH